MGADITPTADGMIIKENQLFTVLESIRLVTTVSAWWQLIAAPLAADGEQDATEREETINTPAILDFFDDLEAWFMAKVLLSLWGLENQHYCRWHYLDGCSDWEAPRYVHYEFSLKGRISLSMGRIRVLADLLQTDQVIVNWRRWLFSEKSWLTPRLVQITSTWKQFWNPLRIVADRTISDRFLNSKEN